MVNKLLSVVSNRKITKSESNSQLGGDVKFHACCFQPQNYKIWKQFTTFINVVIKVFALFPTAKLQNLKAIHNWVFSQTTHGAVVSNRKITKSESNSQHPIHIHRGRQRCFQPQNYKIWKQFTTCAEHTHPLRQLFPTAKLQNLKAIHNAADLRKLCGVLFPTAKLQNLKAIHNTLNWLSTSQYVVSNRKITKSESNSQRSRAR